MNQQHRPDAAVGVASAIEGPKFRTLAQHQIDDVTERVHRAQRKPITEGVGGAQLALHVVGQVTQCVALRVAACGGDVFVASRETHGLERNHRDLVGVVDGELDDGPYLVVVDPVDDGHDQHHVDARGVQVVDGLKLHVEQVAHFAVRVGFVRYAIELQVTQSQACALGLLAELRILGEADAVAGALHAEVPDLTRIRDGSQEMWTQRGLPTGELHAELTLWFDRQTAVEDLLDLGPIEFVDEAHLIGIHETGIAHHVAAVRQIDGQDTATTVLDGRSAVVAQ